jgi:hypothetical protein
MLVKGNYGIVDVFPGVSSTALRRAQKIICPVGYIESASMYHNGGTGNFILAAYTDNAGKPDVLLGKSASIPINASAGWQTLPMESLIPVAADQEVWLAWVYQTIPGVRYQGSSNQRAQSAEGWAGGMPAEFGASDLGGYEYSCYFTILNI